MSEMLLGRPVADALKQKTATTVKQCGFSPKLVTVGFSEPRWLQYANSIAKSAPDYGVQTQNFVADGMTAEGFSQLIAEISSDCSVDGVLVQQPLPKEFAHAVNCISVGKDVDCLSDLSLAKLYKGQECLYPATPLAVLELLDYYKIDLKGKNVVIVGRGNTVGKPLALMMLKRNATVTVCHTKTVDLPSICRRADIVVSACGVADLITAQFVTEKSIVVDVGLSFVDGKTCGDVCADVYGIAHMVSPVPGGVGPITRAALFGNLLQASLKNRLK